MLATAKPNRLLPSPGIDQFPWKSHLSYPRFRMLAHLLFHIFSRKTFYFYLPVSTTPPNNPHAVTAISSPYASGNSSRCGSLRNMLQGTCIASIGLGAWLSACMLVLISRDAGISEKPILSAFSAISRSSTARIFSCT